MAVRVPTPNVSMVDLVVNTAKPITEEAMNQAFKDASLGDMKGILGVTEKPWVSSDMIGNPHSSVIDLPLTTVLDGNLLKIVSWYDNEWGFSNRMLDLAKRLTT